MTDQSIDRSNRPISVLPIINSIFERHISNCLVDYLESNSLLYNHQSGFRRLHSCQTALTKIVDNWLNAINNSETVGTVFLDLTKAFDLVNHKLLIQKLAAYKFSSSTQSWFQSYLTNRSQQVNISGKLSDPQHIAAGVPQGSVLGPLLFLIYINDLPLSIQTCILDLFADDATLSCSDPSILNLTNCLNEDLKNFQDWCIRNDMVVNVPKTKAMFIASCNAANRVGKKYRYAGIPRYFFGVVRTAAHLPVPRYSGFLAHLSQRLIGELIGYSWSSVRPSSVVNNFKRLLLRNRWADQSQILCGASLGRGNNILFAASGSHDQDGRHAHIW